MQRVFERLRRVFERLRLQNFRYILRVRPLIVPRLLVAAKLVLVVLIVAALAFLLNVDDWDWKALMGWRALIQYIAPDSATQRKEALQVYVVIVAGVIASITAAVGLANLRLTRKNLDQQRELEAQRAQATALQDYYEQMGKFLNEYDLLSTEPLAPIRLLARAQTLTVLRELHASRKGTFMAFLQAAGLIDRENPVVGLTGADLRDADLRSVDLRRTDLRGADLMNANLEAAYLEDASLEGSNLTNADLSRAYLIKADLSHTYLSRANLSRANLTNADLSRANLGGADLSHTYLKDANLSRALLEDANLEGSNLTNADLSRTILRRADLGGADLGGADLLRANLADAMLRGATGITNEQLEQQAEVLGGAIMPDDQKYDEDWFRKTKSSNENYEDSGPS